MSRKIISNIFSYAVQEGFENLVIYSNENCLLFDYYLSNGKRKTLSLPKKYENSLNKKIHSFLGIEDDELVNNKENYLNLNGKKIRFKTSNLLNHKGEKIIINFKLSENKNWRLNELGFDKKQKESIKKAINKNSGLIIISGDENSGKSATLSAIVNEINEERNICFMSNQEVTKNPGINFLNISSKIISSLKFHDVNVVAIDEINSDLIFGEAFKLAYNGHLVIASIRSKNPKELAKRIKDAPWPEKEKKLSLNLIIFSKLEKLKRNIKNKKDKREIIGRFKLMELK